MTASMRTDNDTPGNADAGMDRTPDVEGDTLLRDVDTPHLRNEVHRRLFGRVVDPVRIGRFPVLRRLGQGGMGVVYAAFDNELDRKVAIKLLRPGLGDDGMSLRDRLLREARALARLSHPSIVQVYEAGEHDGQVYLAMEFVEGRTLRQWCDAEPRSLRELLDKFLQAGEGLAAAHAAGLVHRDFKPDNVIVGNDGRVRVLDFGLAMLGTEPDVASTADVDDAPLDRLTRTGAVIGTPAYMAPEQFLGHPADARSDQFSFAVTLYESLFGTRPFAGETFDQLRTSVLHGEVATTPGRSGAAPVARALRRALLPDRERRYRDLDELLAVLRATQRRRGLTVGVIGTLVALGITGFFVQQRNREAEVASLTAVVDSLGTEVQGERTRAEDAETQLRQRADVLTLAEARFSARRDPSLALALLSRLSDDDGAWGPEAWTLAQRSAAEHTAEEIVPVPEGHTVRRIVLDGRAMILEERASEGGVLWFPWEDRQVVLAKGRHRNVRVDERRTLVQSESSNSSILWDLDAGAPIASVPDLDLGWPVLSEDPDKILVRGQSWWNVVDLRTLARDELRIPASRMLVFAGGSADWGLTIEFERIDADGKVRARLPNKDDDNSIYDSLGDGRFARLVGRRLQIWSAEPDEERVLDLADSVSATTSMIASARGDRVAIGDVDGGLAIVDTGSLAVDTIRPANGRIDARTWLADDRLLFAGTLEGGVLVDVRDGTVVTFAQGPEIDKAGFDGEERLVVAGDREVRRWSLGLEAHDDPRGRDLLVIDGPAIGGTYVALRGGGELVRWAGGRWEPVGRHVGATTLTIAATGDRVVTAGPTGLICWSLSTGQSWRIREHLDNVALIDPPSIDPDGRVIAVHRDGALEIIDAVDGTSRQLISGRLTDPVFAPDEPRFYATGMRGRDHHLRRWDTTTWQELPEVPISGMFLGVGKGGRLAVRDPEGARIVELGTGEPTKLIPLRFVIGARFSSDGRSLAVTGRDGGIELADIETGRVGLVAPRLRARAQTMGELMGSGYRTDERRVVFSRDGTRVLVVDSDGALQRSRPLPPTEPAELRAWVRANAPRLPSSATLDQLAPDDALR